MSLNCSSEQFSLETSSSRKIKFVVLLCLEPFALICNLYLLIYLIKDGNLRRTLHHHVIFSLLLVTFLTNSIEIPRILHYLKLGFVDPFDSFSCLSWQYFDYLFYSEVNLLMLWASLERHFLVFHQHFYRTRGKRLFYHYFPILFILIYSILFYSILILINPCKKEFDLISPLCGSPCFTRNSILSLIDLFLHSWIPTFFVAFFSFSLLFRVVSRRRNISPSHCRRYRRMIVQFFSISLIHFVCMGPYTFIQILDFSFRLSPQMIFIKDFYLFYIYWFLTLFLPFISISSLPELKKRFRRQIRRICLRSNSIGPFLF